jgi:hypothetical protein
MQPPEPLHVLAPVHWLYGSRPLSMKAHVPVVTPVFVITHDWQAAPHA